MYSVVVTVRGSYTVPKYAYTTHNGESKALTPHYLKPKSEAESRYRLKEPLRTEQSLYKTSSVRTICKMLFAALFK